MVTDISAKNSDFRRHSIKDIKLSQSECPWKRAIQQRTEMNIIKPVIPGSYKYLVLTYMILMTVKTRSRTNTLCLQLIVQL